MGLFKSPIEEAMEIDKELSNLRKEINNLPYKLVDIKTKNIGQYNDLLGRVRKLRGRCIGVLKEEHVPKSAEEITLPHLLELDGVLVRLGFKTA